MYKSAARNDWRARGKLTMKPAEWTAAPLGIWRLKSGHSRLISKKSHIHCWNKTAD
ncbi:hypothetical protein BN873_10117 [Candidatus Competibacter denitrificans Run_A_D11]|uniref:Uncharacterized protein n=1 Tax=Candidatus Competibacter denitrificans Run_A_D11 TaxID=1400863 RepID=W6M0I0_9GAMM|nr:hypothetical protein BN873_10117 [Candidatus Competibacter denitrificans Run_A_D11]